MPHFSRTLREGGFPLLKEVSLIVSSVVDQLRLVPQASNRDHGQYSRVRGPQDSGWLQEPAMGMFQQLSSTVTLFCGSVNHIDHNTQPVLTRVGECGEAEWLFRPGNRAQHLCRRGYWPLGSNKYHLDHCPWRKERGQSNQAAGQGNALQLPGDAVSVLVAKDNGDGIGQLQPLRALSWLGLDDLSHWHPVCSGFLILGRSRRGWYCFHSRLSARPISAAEATRTAPLLALPIPLNQ
jgi:hypothetical protein